MLKTPYLSEAATGVLEGVLRLRSTTAPNAWMHGTGLPFAGTSAAAAAQAIDGADVVAVLPGSPSRGAPV